MQDTADHPPVVDARRPRPAMRQVRLDDPPSLVTQPKEIVHGHLHERPTTIIESETASQIK